ncbi:hypothetical protein NCS13_1_0298 [Neochlamydia sp. S13]|nr:hypothetical protein NCS13_1_0298 [Neochlamydia sp. S13]
MFRLSFRREKVASCASYFANNLKLYIANFFSAWLNRRSVIQNERKVGKCIAALSVVKKTFLFSIPDENV